MLIAVKKICVTLAVFTMLFTAMPKKQAEAGIIVSPIGVGIILIVLGVMHDSLLLIILDDNSNDQLAAKLSQKYGHLSSNEEAFLGLANMIKERTNLVEIKGETELNFSKAEIAEALGPAAANRALLNAVYTDLR